MAPWKGLVAAAILVAFIQPIGLSAAQPDAKRQAEIASLVGDLGHEEFARRESAVERLVLAGSEAFEPLLAAAQSQNTEIAWRATSALQQISPTLTGEVQQTLLEALARIDTARHPHLANVVANLQVRARRQKHEQALATIRALGGTTEAAYVPDELPTAIPASRSTSIPIRELDPRIKEVLDGGPRALAEFVPFSVPVNSGPAPGAAIPVSEVSHTKAALLDAPAAPPAIAEAEAKILPAEAVVDVSELLDAAGEPAPPPDFLPTTGPGEIPALEGEIADAFVGDAEIGGAGPAVPENVALNPVPCLWLTTKWRGGDEGLVHLKDLPELGELGLIGADVTDAALKHIEELPNLAYLTVHGTRITSAGLRELRKQRPTLVIKAVGRTKIGISAEVDGNRCRVALVNPGSAADIAGLQVGDYVLRAGDVEVESFVDLMIATFDRDPGHKLPVEFERNGERKTAVIELAERRVSR